MAVLGARAVQLPVGEERSTWKADATGSHQLLATRPRREDNEFLAVHLIYGKE